MQPFPIPTGILTKGAGFWLLAQTAVLIAQVPQQEAIEAARALFVANHGQWSAAAGFRIARGGASAWLEQDGLTIDLRRAVPMDAAAAATDGPGAMEPAAYTTARARLSFVGARSTVPAGEERHTARAHFVLGNDPAAWRHDVPMFRSARWSAPWPGIDVRAQSHADGLLEFDLELSAGVDPRGAVLQWEGIEKIDHQDDGALRIHTAAGELLQSAPVAWQVESDGTKLPVAVTVEMLEGSRFRFRVDQARQDLPLVIDPVLCYHGGAGTEAALGVARDAAGRVVVAGITDSAPASGFDVLVSCFDFTPPIPILVWTTTLGGSLFELAFDIDADAGGFFTLVGATSSADFPVMNALQPGFGGGVRDGFVVQLDQNGALTSTTYATYHGGAGDDWCCRVEMDQQLQATVAGYSDSTTLPAVGSGSYQPTNAGLRDAFVVRFSPFGTAHVYATWLGGTNHEGILSNPFNINSRVLGLDIDAAGRVLLTGLTTSDNFPVTPNARQPNLSGGADSFVTILDPSQQPTNQLAYSTYLGGASGEGGMAARFGPGGTVVVGGYTYSSNFPTTPGAFQTTFVVPANFNDAFLVYLDLNPLTPPAAQLTYGTFFGGTSTTASSHYDGVLSLTVDGRGHASVVGFCSGNAPWPTQCGAFQPIHGGQQDAFVVRMRPLGTGANDVTYATFLGGALDDAINDVELEPDGGIALGGRTASANIPGVLGALNGPLDMLVGTMEVLPVGVTRGPGSSAYCASGPSLGTVMLEVDRQPAAGATFAFLIGGTPPVTFGLLGLNFGQTAPPVPFLGALLCLSLAPLPVAPLLVSDQTGAASLTLPVPAGWPIPLGIHAQVVWLAPAACALPFTSSATLTL